MLNTRLESVKTDSGPVPYPVGKELSKWERTKIDYGGTAMLSAAALVVGLRVAIVWLIRKKNK